MTSFDDEHFLADIAAFLDASQAVWSVDGDAEELLPTNSHASELDAPENSAPPTVNAHASEPPESSHKKCAKSRNVTRERRQRELRELRAQCAELEKQVAELRQQQQQQCRDTRSPPQQLLFATWRQIVRRQLVMRVESECENERLRGEVAQHVAIARTVETSMGLWAAAEGGARLPLVPSAASATSRSSVLAAPERVLRRPTDSSALVATPARVAMQPFTHADASDVAVFQHLLAEVDSEYARMDDVFTENGLLHWRVTSRTTTAQLKVRPGRPNTSVYMEQLEADVLPFDVETVFKASWQCWQRRKLPRSSALYEPLVAVDDRSATVLSKLLYEVVVGGESVVLECFCALKAYAEHGRRSYVMRAITKADAHFPGVYVDETDWQLATPVPGLGPGQGTTATFSCAHLEAKQCAGADVVPDAHASPLTTLTVTTFVADMDELNTMMMNALLGDASEPGCDDTTAVPDAKVAYVRQVQ